MMLPTLRRTVSRYTRCVRDLLVPRFCVSCGVRLTPSERFCCLNCLGRFPYTGTWRPGNERVLRHFYVQVPVERAAALVRYDEFTRHLLFIVKYFNSPEFGVYLGELMADVLQPDGFFEGIDRIVPIPLNKVRARKRGYNQSECLALGISRRTGIPVDTRSVVRWRNNPTQTRKNKVERLENVRDVFAVAHPESLRGAHILIIDDVLTTGATTNSCAIAIAEVPGVKISILTFAQA